GRWLWRLVRHFSVETGNSRPQKKRDNSAEVCRCDGRVSDERSSRLPLGHDQVRSEQQRREKERKERSAEGGSRIPEVTCQFPWNCVCDEKTISDNRGHQIQGSVEHRCVRTSDQSHNRCEKRSSDDSSDESFTGFHFCLTLR